MMAEAGGMAEFTGRELHLVKKALAIAVLAIDRHRDRFNRRRIKAT
jgi:hypothetical protein